MFGPGSCWVSWSANDKPHILASLCREGSSDIAQSSGTDAGTTSVAGSGVRNLFSSSLCAVLVVTSSNSSSDFVGSGS